MLWFKSKELKKAYKELTKVNLMKNEISKLNDIDLKNKTDYFKKLLAEGYTLSDIRIEAFAVAREATYRILKKWLFDVQILGSLILDYGSVAEMKTGEGKTIASIPVSYLNALSGQGVMIATVNEYLAKRDAEETGKVYAFLGLKVGVNRRDLTFSDKKIAYYSDITYSVHSEIGFDYLRDNMVRTIEDKVQRGLNFILVDEVDSILIDESRTPLIITGGEINSSNIYIFVDKFVKSLKPEQYDIDWEAKSIQLSELGSNRANEFFNLSNIFQMEHSDLVHRIQNALRANYIMSKDVDYIISEDQVLIVDSFTGRVMEGRQFSDGLHQAIQAKENVKIMPETKVLATITYQNLFRMFNKLSGMTGTAKTEEEEFLEIYNMRVNVIPTNKPIIRKDYPDKIYYSSAAKYKAILEEIQARNAKGQPILVGTEEIKESEQLSNMLSKSNIKHTVLNAKQNQKEAEIIAKAGQEFSVTIATNMAGRGTDIQPSAMSLKLGGLLIIGTCKSEAERIDKQLKGRSGRQGDPGESLFYLSLDDKLISRFSNKDKFKKTFKFFDEKQIKGKLINLIFNRAQKKIEGFNFDTRKHVLQYDNVIRYQRDLIYSQRDIILSQHEIKWIISRMFKSVISDVISDKSFLKMHKKDGEIIPAKATQILNSVWFPYSKIKLEISDFENKNFIEIIDLVYKKAILAFEEIRAQLTQKLDVKLIQQIEKQIILKVLDKNWQFHIEKMTKFKFASSMASYAQKNPYQVYVEKGSNYFKDLLKRISHNTIKLIMQNQYIPQIQKDLKNESQSQNQTDINLKAVLNQAKETKANLEKPEKTWQKVNSEKLNLVKKPETNLDIIVNKDEHKKTILVHKKNIQPEKKAILKEENLISTSSLIKKSEEKITPSHDLTKKESVKKLDLKETKKLNFISSEPKINSKQIEKSPEIKSNSDSDLNKK